MDTGDDLCDGWRMVASEEPGRRLPERVELDEERDHHRPDRHGCLADLSPDRKRVRSFHYRADPNNLGVSVHGRHLSAHLGEFYVGGAHCGRVRGGAIAWRVCLARPWRSASSPGSWGRSADGHGGGYCGWM